MLANAGPCPAGTISAVPTPARGPATVRGEISAVPNLDVHRNSWRADVTSNGYYAASLDIVTNATTCWTLSYIRQDAPLYYKQPPLCECLCAVSKWYLPYGRTQPRLGICATLRACANRITRTVRRVRIKRSPTNNPEKHSSSYPRRQCHLSGRSRWKKKTLPSSGSSVSRSHTTTVSFRLPCPHIRQKRHETEACHGLAHAGVS